MGTSTSATRAESNGEGAQGNLRETHVNASIDDALDRGLLLHAENMWIRVRNGAHGALGWCPKRLKGPSMAQDSTGSLGDCFMAGSSTYKYTIVNTNTCAPVMLHRQHGDIKFQSLILVT